MPKPDAQTRSRHGRKRRCTTVPAAGISTTKAPTSLRLAKEKSEKLSVTSAVTRSKLASKSSNANTKSKGATSVVSRPDRSQSRLLSSSRAPSTTSRKEPKDSKPSRFRVFEGRGSRSRSTARQTVSSTHSSRLNRTKSVVASKKPRLKRVRAALGSIDANSQGSHNSSSGAAGLKDQILKKPYRLVTTDADDSSLNTGIGGVKLDFSKDFVKSKSTRRNTTVSKALLRRSTRLRTRHRQSGSESSLSALPMSGNSTVARNSTAKRAKTSHTQSTVVSLLEQVGRGSSLDTLECDNSSRKSDSDTSTEAHNKKKKAIQERVDPQSGASQVAKISRRSTKKRLPPTASARRARGASSARSASRARTDRSHSKKRLVAGGGDSSSDNNSDDERLQALRRAHNQRLRKFDYVPRQHSRKDYAEVRTVVLRVFVCFVIFLCVQGCGRVGGRWYKFLQRYTS